MCVRTAATGDCDLLQMNNYNENGCMTHDLICAIRFSSNKCASHGQIMSLWGPMFLCAQYYVNLVVSLSEKLTVWRLMLQISFFFPLFLYLSVPLSRQFVSRPNPFMRSSSHSALLSIRANLPIFPPFLLYRYNATSAMNAKTG